ncbi:MAG: Trm112 family protein [Peptococcaceae bacterium]|nr:MAG: Trm112 family protein [Peptococcaceae bacterium]
MLTNEELFAILVCPVCKVSLEKRDSGIFCSTCCRLYPIRDEIPIMLIEEAEIIKPQ